MNLAIVGTGRIANRAVNEIRASERFSIVAVVNPNIEHAKEFAVKHEIPDYYQKMDQLLKLGTDLEAVYIATPHEAHYEYAKAALIAGKHVICEKPMVLNRMQALELYELAEKDNLILMEAIKTASCPGFLKLCEIANSGKIGKIIDVEAAFTRLTERSLREFTDKKAGGSFTEFASYTMLPILRFLGTDYKDISFFSVSSDDNDDSVDGYTKAYFNYGNKSGTCKTGLTVKSEGQLVISGTKGYILAKSPWWLTKYFEVRYEDSQNIEQYKAEFLGDGLRYEFEEFFGRINSIRENREFQYQEAIKRDKTESIVRAKVMEEFLSERRL
ncbi:Gfo/Idh/MocA family protein [Butyrivibrio sp. MB2005]|uniref:Gfo/Idh/MocA family protein n=1 Tax=Butyrivibrio sp. MB2005 TaxID=1280678 RepID=UPI00041C44B5|nr:Gfo/Idh/MocA family oxidoreductase [Butyrivibrio sp. MB2005]